MSEGLAGGSGVTPRLSANGLVNSDRNESIAWVPACAAPVPASPESCVKAAASWAGGLKMRRLWNAGGSVPPLLMKASMAFATANSLPGAEDGNADAAETAVVVQIVMLLVSSVTAPLRAKAAPQLMLASVFSVMLVNAMMSPMNDVVVPSVAEVPMRKKTLPPCAPLIN